MRIHCAICSKPFREEDEIRAEMDCYWHELGSRVHYSVTKPHNVMQSTMRHVSCINELEADS